MTLVEALVGSVLLGTLLVSILIAKGRLTVQAAESRGRAQAVRVLNELLQGWWADPPSLPRQASGDVPDRPGWRWRTRSVPNTDAAAVVAEVIAVELFSPSYTSGPPSARVEILLPVEEKTNATQPGHNAG